MRILYVWSAAEFATYDVARGWRNALARQGHEIWDYRFYNALKYHAAALSKSQHPERARNLEYLCEIASEYIIVEAVKREPDWVVIASAPGFHPNTLHYLKKLGMHIAVVHTESPYEDEEQAEFSKFVDVTFTNDKYSADQYGWYYTGSSYDPEFHRPVEHTTAEPCDVIFIGTAWPERVEIMEGVNWDDIRLRIHSGNWPDESPLSQFVVPEFTSNPDNSALYASAKIAVNQHRYSPHAWSLGPRSYELAGHGIFQISDERPELHEVFDHTVPTYRTSQELEDHIRFWLDHDERRQQLAHAQHERLHAGPYSFDDKAALAMTILQSRR